MNFASPAAETSRLSRRADGIYERREKTGERREFDSAGLQIASIDRNGTSTTYAYDAEERLETITDPIGLDTTFVYVGDHLESITDPAGRATTFTHDPAGNLRTITDPDLTTRTFAYGLDRRMISQETKRGAPIVYVNDFAGQNRVAHRPDGTSRKVDPLTAVALGNPAAGIGTEADPLPVVRFDEAESVYTDGRGNQTRFKTNRFGTVGEKRDALGQSSSIAFDENGNPSAVTNAAGQVTEMDWDGRSNLLRLRQAVGSTVERESEYVYEPEFAQLVRVDDAADFSFRYVLDERGNPEEIIDPLDEVVVLDWDAFGRLDSRTDQRQKTTLFDYDTEGNLFEVTDALGRVTRLLRDPAGNVTDAIQAFGTADERRWVVTYDAMNRVETITNPASETTTYTYDEAGNRTSVERPSGLVTTATFDREERLETISSPAIGLTRFDYDGNGNLTDVTDPALRTTTYGFDALDRLETVLSPDGGFSITTYDAANRVDTFQNALGKLTDFEWDDLDRLVSQTNPELQTLTFDYQDELRDLVKVFTDAKGQSFVHEYDGLGRRATTVTPDETIVWTYDEAGNLRTVTDADSVVELTYDDLGRLATSSSAWMGGSPIVLTHGYHPSYNRRESVADSLGGTTGYTYDAADRLDVVTAPSLAQVDLDWDVDGRLTSITHSTGVAASFTYDPVRGLLESLTWTQGAIDRLDLGYTYDGLGRIDTVTEDGVAASHLYDEVGRLEGAGPGGAPETYRFDEVGNRTSSHLSSLHDYDDADRLLEDDLFIYTYDANGNLETRTEKATSVTTTFTYDAQNRLIGVTGPGGVATYRYDGLGRRFEKVVNGVTTRYVHDGPDIVIELDGVGTVAARYTHGTLVDQPLVMTRGGVDHAYLTDHLGSVRAVADDAGGIVNSYRYDAFGQTLAVSEAVTNPFTYTAREQDPESGLLHYRARAYDPTMGRFTSQDPIGFAGGDVNLYAYVANNPANYTDPSGLFAPWDLADAAFFALSLNDFINCPGILTGLATLLDGFGLALPFIPAVAGAFTHADEAADVAVDALNAADEAVAAANEAAQGILGALQDLANNIHNLLDPRARNHRTTAALQTDNGTVVAGGGVDLQPNQIEALGPGQLPAKQGGAHAEVTAINHAHQAGDSLQAIATSRPICPDCAAFIQSTGGTITSPTTAVWP